MPSASDVAGPATPPSRARPRWRLHVRLIAVLAGGYACTALAVTVLAALLAQAGMARSEAVVLMAMLGFPLYLVILLWGFAVRRLRTLLLALAGAGIALSLVWMALH